MNSKPSITRRRFVQSATTAALALPAIPVLSSSPTRKYRTALLGSGWWGLNILTAAMKAGRSKVVGLCDVDVNKTESAADLVEDLSGDKPKLYRDFRELLAKEKPEIVIAAAPDHWHALLTIAALKAGAHVFVEKPTGHTIRESRAMASAAKQADRLVQVGLHRRIGPHYVSARKFLREGKAGDIGMVRAFVHGRGGPEQPTPNSEPPDGLDWNLYCGPAPLRPFNRKIHPGGFRNFLDFANGTLGDWGVHWLDQVLLWTDEKYPRRVYSTGGRPVKGKPVFNEKEQTTDAPDSQVAVFEFESFTATWEHRQFAGASAEKSGIGVYFSGTKGTLHLGWRDGWTFYPADTKQATVHEDAQIEQPDGHNLTLFWADFIDGIDKGRKPAGDVETAHLATNLSLLGMLSCKLGRSIQWDGAKEQIIGDAEANRLLSREYRAPWVYPAGFQRMENLTKP